MTNVTEFTAEGGCTCRAVRYRLTSKPMFVHCCHCSWCQRETGASFALNAMIEADRVVLLAEGRILTDGPPARALDDAAIGRAYGVDVRRVNIDGRDVPLPWMRRPG